MWAIISFVGCLSVAWYSSVCISLLMNCAISAILGGATVHLLSQSGRSVFKCQLNVFSHVLLVYGWVFPRDIWCPVIFSPNLTRARVPHGAHVYILSVAWYVSPCISPLIRVQQCNQAWEEHQFIFCHSLAVCF
jgi:hypothetical protein